MYGAFILSFLYEGVRDVVLLQQFAELFIAGADVRLFSISQAGPMLQEKFQHLESGLFFRLTGGDSVES